MIQISVLYPRSERFDMDYYLTRHIPMVQEVLGSALERAEVFQGMSGMAPDQPPTYQAGVHMYAASVDAFMAAFGPHADRVLADIPNYTDAQPVVQISKVVG